MKFRKGLVIGLGLALSLQSVVVFANDVTSVATETTSTVTLSAEGLTEESATEETATEETATEETEAEEPEAEEPATEEPATEETATEETATEETEAEEPEAEEPATEEPEAEEPEAEELATEEPTVEEQVVEEPVVEILDNQVPLADVLVPEIKANATLLITNKLLCDDGELICQEEITDLVAGTTVNISDYVKENEDIKAVNGTETIELKEGQNEIVIVYKFLTDIEEENNNTAKEEYIGELMR